MGMLIVYHQKLSGLNELSDSAWQEIASCLPGRSGEDCKFKFMSFCKNVVKDFPWNAVEDELMIKLVDDPQTVDWVQVAKQVYSGNPLAEKVFRSGKQCRQHFYCHLDPALKRGGWTKKEDKTLIALYQEKGRKWFQMTKYLAGRNENSIKNRFAVICREDGLYFHQESDCAKVRETRKQIGAEDQQNIQEEEEYNSEQSRQKKPPNEKTKKGSKPNQRKINKIAKNGVPQLAKATESNKRREQKQQNWSSQCLARKQKSSFEQEEMQLQQENHSMHSSCSLQNLIPLPNQSQENLLQLNNNSYEQQLQHLSRVLMSLSFNSSIDLQLKLSADCFFLVDQPSLELMAVEAVDVDALLFATSLPSAPLPQPLIDSHQQ